MEGYWITVAWGLAALLAVSVLVALVEHLRDGAKPRQPTESPLPRALKIDLHLGETSAATPPSRPAPAPMPAPTPPHDAESRRAALNQVLQRAQQAGPEAAWAETRPAVLAPKSDATTT